MPSDVVTRRRFLVGVTQAFAAAALSGGAAACGPLAASRESQGSPHAVAALGPAVLTFGSINPQTSPLGQAFAEAIELFGQRHPQVRVELEFIGGADYLAKLLIRIAAASGVPDIFSLQSIYLMRLVGLAAVYSLQPFMRREPSYRPGELFFAQLIDAFTIRGLLYGLPGPYNVIVLGYNTEHFARAGLATPNQYHERGRWTWDALLELARALTSGEDEATRQYGVISDPTWWHTMLWMWQNGGGIYDSSLTPNRTTLRLPASYDALRWWADLVLRHRVAPRLEVLQQHGGAARFFGNGQAAIALVGATSRGDLNRVGVPYDVAPLPRRARRATFIGGQSQVLSKSTRHPEAAWRLLQFSADKEAMEIRARLGVQPAMKEVAHSRLWLRPDLPPPHARHFVDEIEVGQGLYRILDGDGLVREINGLTRTIWSGEETARAAAEAASPIFERLRQEAA